MMSRLSKILEKLNVRDIVHYIKAMFLSGSERSVKTKINIVLSFVVKFLSMALNLAIIPLTLGYVGKLEYGIWLTLSSVVNWINLFDIGLGGGLRNKLTEALAQNNITLARKYVSTAYAAISIIAVCLIAAFFIINPFLDWSTILNTKHEFSNRLNILAYIVFVLFCLQFVLKLINTILTADQRTGISSVISFLGSLLGFSGILILMYTSEGSLVLLGLVFSLSPVVVLVGSSVYFFFKTYRSIAPSLKFVDFKCISGISNLGFQFFFIQISGLIVYSSSNILISHFFGPSEVTPYNVAYRLFSSISSIFFVLLAPFTPAFTDAFSKGDFMWIRKVVEKLVKYWIILFIFSIGILIISPIIFDIWLGGKVEINFILSTCFVIFIILQTWNAIFTTFLNGVGKIRLQLYMGIIEAVLFIPLAYLLSITLKMGIPGLVLTSTFSYFSGAIWTVIQYKKIITNRATGIWGK